MLVTFKAFVAIHRSYKGDAISKSQGSFKTFGKSLLKARLHFETVNHYFDLVLALFVERWNIVDVIHDAVDAQPNEALAAHGLHNLKMFAFAVPDNRSKDHQLAVLRHCKYLINHLADGLRLQWLAVIRTSRFACASKHQPQVIVDLCDGTDCRARVVGC